MFQPLGLKAQRLSRSVSGPPVRFGPVRWSRSVGRFRVRSLVIDAQSPAELRQLQETTERLLTRIEDSSEPTWQ
jgi:hypothetical protein